MTALTYELKASYAFIERNITSSNATGVGSRVAVLLDHELALGRIHRARRRRDEQRGNRPVTFSCSISSSARLCGDTCR